MNENNDTIAINGRIKNAIAAQDMALSPAGMVLVNVQTHFLKKLYDFSETLHGLDRKELKDLLREGEDLPRAILSILAPKQEDDETETE